MATVGFETSEALKILKVSTSDWRTAKDKGIYTCAPPARNGKRAWTADDLLCLSWFDALCASGMPRPLAGGMAAELSKAIARQPDATEFNVYAWERDEERGGLSIGSEPPPDAPNARLILVVPLAQWRSNVLAAIENFYAGRGARRGRS